MKPSRRPRLSPLPWYERLFTGCWTLFLGVSACLLLYASYREPIRPHALGWRTVTGQILQTGIQTELDHGEKWFVPEVSYQYFAGNRVRTSSRVEVHAPRFRDREEAEAWLAQYPRSADVTVYFRNKREQLPLLDRGYTFRWILFFSSLGATVLAIFGLRHQFQRNTIAYREGLPAKVVAKRTPQPIRSAQEGEVRAGKGYARTLAKMIRPTQAYRKFRK